MADVALKKLEDQLNCLVCLDTYTDPKQLQCHHVFCHKCLVPLMVREQQEQLTLTCPTCRQVTPVPANGVAGLQTAFQTSKLLEIVEEHKKATTSASTDKAENGFASSPYEKIPVCCHEHSGKEVDLYCATCEEPICLKCVVKSGKHFGHEAELLGEAYKHYKQEITSSLEPMEKQLAIVEKALAELDKHSGEISDQQAVIEDNIHQTFEKLRKVLNVRETELIGQLHQITQGKLKDLAVQREQIETTLAQLSSCLDFVNESLKTSSEGEVLMMKTTIVKQVKELTSTFQPDILKPNTDADMVFSALRDLTAKCQNYEQVLTHRQAICQIPPSAMPQVVVHVEVAKVGKKSTAILQIFDCLGQPSEEWFTKPECELVSEITGSRVRGSIESRGWGKYEISYQLTIKGRHQLHVKVEGQHIRGSPFGVVAKSPVKKLGTPILTIGGVNRPCGVAITQRGEVVVTEGNKHCVSVFNPNGDKLRSFGSPGLGQGQFNCPYGIAVDGDGHILVADTENCRIQKFTVEGQFLTTVGIKGGAQPWAIAYNKMNSQLYVLVVNDSIQILNSDLSYFSTFGKRGRDRGQLHNAYSLTCDSSGNVYVANTENHHIQVFTAEGKFLNIIGRRGNGKGELESPRGIAVDIRGKVYVGDFGNDRVSVFTSKGEFVTFFGERGTGNEQGKFRDPHGLAVDSTGVIYVCDFGNNRIQVF